MAVILYERQRQILEFVAQFIQRYGYAPTLKDIGTAMELSSLATVHEHLDQLKKKGVIKITGYGKARKMDIVDKQLSNMSQGVQLPIVGYVAEGMPIETYTQPNAFYYVSPHMLVGAKRNVILEVKGDSLVEEGLLNKDLLVLEEESQVKSGDVVVAILENEIAALRRFFKEETRVRLEALHSQKLPIFATQVKIQGKIISSIRQY